MNHLLSLQMRATRAIRRARRTVVNWFCVRVRKDLERTASQARIPMDSDLARDCERSSHRITRVGCSGSMEGNGLSRLQQHRYTKAVLIEWNP
jgi:hypothetical protein